MSIDWIELAIDLLAVGLVVISASLHEFGHAFAAHCCGDDTAKEQGRLTINPLAHIDPFGSVLLPFLLVMSGFGYMAYAKPVPYNPYRLKNPRRDEVIVAVAGPVANVLQALVGAVLYHVCLKVMYGDASAPLSSSVQGAILPLTGDLSFAFRINTYRAAELPEPGSVP